MKKVLCLEYPPTVVGQPVMYQLVARFHLGINILRARVEPGEGWLEVEVEGGSDTITTAIAWLEEQGIQVGDSPSVQMDAA
jgi:L-aspartate semialdehyde sulfurtransferase ferredoxin